MATTPDASTDARAILDRLIAFDTVSHRPNLDLIHYARDLLAAAGARVVLVPDSTGAKANLYATVGPEGGGGVMLSGHTDVVPVEGQDWTRPPFRLTTGDGRLYGRGTADMKGFVACAMAAMLDAARRPLRTPMHLALSHDEEVGCIGVRSLIDLLAGAPARPSMVIVGEPTDMQVATGHKGKVGMRATFHGRAGHSALAPLALNALHLGADFVGAARAEQARIAADGPRDGDYDVPYTTVHVGILKGGTQVNIVPALCVAEYEVRSLAEDDADAILSRLRAAAEALAAATGDPAARVEFVETMRYPGLGTPPTAPIVAFVKALTGANGTIKVAYGTEGGLFAEGLGLPVVVCGPGSMAQGHKPDEYLSAEQFDRCGAMLARLVERLEAGL
ncbi:MAG TPA: acetylornithine deacetylase [Paracoccaceae bacterium]|nr:acetylornithine deacetylase [Paracoccaceae bacterium]